MLTDLNLSQPNEILPAIALARGPLRPRKCLFLAATTGVWMSADEVVKYLLLVGADVVMTTSALLRHGVDHMAVLIAGLASWLRSREFASVNQMRES